MDSVENHITWRCTDWKCTFRVNGDMDSPYNEDKCPIHRLQLVKEEVPPSPQPAPPVTHRPEGRIDAFLATERSMETLSDIRRLMGTYPLRELWSDKTLRAAVAAEWETLKNLMKEAGFE